MTPTSRTKASSSSFKLPTGSRAASTFENSLLYNQRDQREQIGFLDAIRTDLNSEFNGNFPVALLNYRNVFLVVPCLVREEMRALFIQKGWELGVYQNVLPITFSKSKTLLQGRMGQRWDTPILRKMGKALEDDWNQVGDKMVQFLLLDGS